MSFGVGIASFSANALRAVEKSIADSRKEIARRIVHRTPVDTGAARQNWKPRGGYNDPVWFFVNDLKTIPYIRRLEYGWSPQAPNGMVRLSAAEWHDIVRQAVRNGQITTV